MPAFTYRRFANLDDMKAGALEIVRNVWNAAELPETKPYAEAGIYTDDSGVSYRPEVMIVTDETVYRLRWDAYSDQPDISHMGKRAKVDAHDAADWFVDQIQSVINQFHNLAYSEPAAPAKRTYAVNVRAVCHLTATLMIEADSPEMAEALASGASVNWDESLPEDFQVESVSLA